MKSLGFPSKKKTIETRIIVKNSVQYGSFDEAIFPKVLGFRYTRKCNIKNNIINITGNLWEDKKGSIFDVWKSNKTYFSIEYSIWSVLLTLNGIHAKNTKYWVIKIEITLPNLLLKNGWIFKWGNLFEIDLWIAR